jgi:hypothetical protein
LAGCFSATATEIKKKGGFLTIAKKCFTVGYMVSPNGHTRDSNPYLRPGGAWLKSLGIGVGDRIGLVPVRGMLVLMKVSKTG